VKLWCVIVLAAPLAAQPEKFADPYAFAERAPRTRTEQVIDELLPSIVKVHGASGLSSIIPYASGLIVSDQGHVVTADLIMLEQDRTRVVLHDGSVWPAKLYPADEALGVRLLKIDYQGERPLRPLQPSANREVRNGTLVVSLGNCYRLAEFSEKVSATFGVVSARVRTGLRYRLADVDYAGELLVTDAANNPGHYGGGLFTLRGEWLGLNTRIVESKETNTEISAAIPAWAIADYVARLTGERAAPADDAAATAVRVHHGIVLFDHGGRRSPPAYVERVLADSPAGALGLRPDDLIVRLDEFPVRTCREFADTMQRFKPGQTIQVTYKRGDLVQRGALTLAEAGR
jgi:serine protease Do